MDDIREEGKADAVMDATDAKLIDTSMDVDSTSDEPDSAVHPPSTPIPAIPLTLADPSSQPTTSIQINPSPLVRSSSEATLVDTSISPPPAKKRSFHKRDSPSKSVDTFATRMRQDTNLRNHTWQQHLYHPYSGTTTLGSTLLKKLAKKGLSSDIATRELAKYDDYELENFTFLQEIIPNLFLGSVLALEADALREAGITRVLSVMTKDPHKKNGFTMHSNIAREYIMMEDIATFQSHPWYQTTSAIIDSALHAGERILIHCRMGISRSATVVAAYLTFRHGLTPLQAISWLRFQRPIVWPNSGFQEQLEDYYSVLQIDHGHDFGWQQLSMCKDFPIYKGLESLKSSKRKNIEEIRQKWKKDHIEWARCAFIDWGEDIERLVQRHISRLPMALDARVSLSVS